MNWKNYKKRLIKSLDKFKFDGEILTILKDSIKNNQKIFVGGNGGSAAIAMHYVCDFSKGATKNWSDNFKRYRPICLSSNISYITAIANDAYYNEIFKQQLINLASPNDILILISSSGNSPNIIEALKYAKKHDLITIGISGFKGGQLKELSDYTAYLDCDSYELCEDIHTMFGHFLATYLREQDRGQDKQ